MLICGMVMVIGIISGDMVAVCHAESRIGPCGRNIPSVVMDSRHAGTIYIADSSEGVYADSSGGVYKSTDGGDNWQAMNQGLYRKPKEWEKDVRELMSIYSLTMDLKNSKIIYVMTQEGIYKSTNGGKKWEPFKRSPRIHKDFSDVSSLIIDPKDADVLYARVFQAFYKSTDGGKKWVNIFDVTERKGYYPGAGIVPPPDVLAIDPQDTEVLYLGHGGSANRDGGIYKSIDGGKNWDIILQTDAIVSALTINPDNPKIIYAGTRSHGIFRSTDGGARWEKINDGLKIMGTGTVYERIAYLMIDPVHSDTVYAGTGVGVFKSTDQGIQWHGLTDGWPKEVAAIQLAIDPKNPMIMYAGTANDYSESGNNGIYKSMDGGKSWEPKNNGLACGKLIYVH